MKTWHIIAALLGGGVWATLVNFPLSLAVKSTLPETLTSQVSIGGTVWDGHVSGGAILGRPAPSVQIKSSFRKLITGQNFANISSSGAGLSFNGELKMGRISDAKLSAPVNLIAYFDNRLAGIEGDFNADISEATFGQSCEAASGIARTDVLMRNRAAWDWAGPNLSGPVTCEGGNVVMALSGQQGQEVVQVDIILSPNGQYRYELSIQSADQRAGFALPLFGFEARGEAFVLAETGNWQELF